MKLQAQAGGRRLSALLLTLGLMATAQAATSFTLTDLGRLGNPADAHGTSLANGINDLGQIVGVSNTGGNAPQEFAFVWQSGGMTSLGTLDANHVYGSYANAINNNSLTVGWSYLTGAVGISAASWQGMAAPAKVGNTSNSIALALNDAGLIVGQDSGQAVKWLGGAKTVLGQGSYSSANAVNALGVIAGTDNDHAVKWNGNQTQVLGSLVGAQYAEVQGLNLGGVAVGYTAMADGFMYATQWASNGSAQQLASIGGAPSTALAINDQGWAVGYSYLSTSSGTEHATLWANGQLIDLNNAISGGLGSFVSLAEARAINSHGQIVGFGFLANGETRAFLLTPVPEPGTWLLMGLGLAGLGLRQRRKA